MVILDQEHSMAYFGASGANTCGTSASRCESGSSCSTSPRVHGQSDNCFRVAGTSAERNRPRRVPSIVCKLHALQRHVDLPGVFVKIGDFIKFKGFLVPFIENRRSWENQTSRKSPERQTFLSLAFYNAPSCTLLILNSKTKIRYKKCQTCHEMSPKMFKPSFVLDFPGALSTPGKGRKRQKRVKKARHPLSPYLLHPHLRQPNENSLIVKWLPVFSGVDMNGRPGTVRWKRMEEVPRRTLRAPLASPYLCLF